MREASHCVRWLYAGIAAVVIAAPIAGCHSDNSQPLSDTQKQGADRLAKAARESGGDWDKVSREDKDYILKNVANGDEHTAKMLIAPPPGRAGGPPGGAPGAGGPPPGGPGTPPGAPAGH
jgi:hypothetical protein